MNIYRIKSEAGFATIIALLMTGMLTLLGLAALSTSDDEVSIAGNGLQEMKTFWAAEAGLAEAAAGIQADIESDVPLGDRLPGGTQVLNNCAVTFLTQTDGLSELEVLTTGNLAGLHAQVQTYSISSAAASNYQRAKIVLSESFKTGLIPIFQFAVFYDNDLEIAPGPAMTLAGRVHTNGNLYLQAGNSLSIDGQLSAALQVFHGRKGAGSTSSGDVLIKDESDNYANMKDGLGWLDSDRSDWYSSSVERWGSRVQDMSHGQQAMNVPLTGSDDAHRLIERGDGNVDSYEHKASLIIKDGIVSQQQEDGSWVDVTAAMIADGTLTFTNDQFYDKRENKWVDCTELDVAKMYANDHAPLNGLVYFTDRLQGADWPGLRLKNGATLDEGLTVASENPIYTLGDYNSNDKKPAALLADAITFLSNAWQNNSYDTKSTASKSERIGANTTVNCSYLTGNIETTASKYNGGFENLPRFLEKWSGKNFTWSGSAVNLWNSTQADGAWGSSYYSPPIREWSYDLDLNDPANLPPKTPVARFFQRSDWKQQFVGYGESDPTNAGSSNSNNGGGNGNGNGNGT